jgi:hypothetical protein
MTMTIEVMPTYSKAQGTMKKKWYVWEMNKYKSRTKQETKARMQREFEDSVLQFAAVIEQQRTEAEYVEGWKSGS